MTVFHSNVNKGGMFPVLFAERDEWLCLDKKRTILFVLRPTIRNFDKKKNTS